MADESGLKVLTRQDRLWLAMRIVKGELERSDSSKGPSTLHLALSSVSHVYVSEFGDVPPPFDPEQRMLRDEWSRGYTAGQTAVKEQKPLKNPHGDAPEAPGGERPCRACRFCYMEPDSGFICGHPDSGLFGLSLSRGKALHCIKEDKFDQHPRRNPDGSLMKRL